MNKLWGVAVAGVILLAGVATAQVTTEFAGDWTIERTQDLFTDEAHAVAYARPLQHPPLGSNDKLVLVCSDNQFTADGVGVMLTGSTFVADDYVEVQRRFDSNESRSDAWSAGRTDLLLYQPATVRAFLAELLDAEQLALRYRGYSQTATYVFPVAGAREMLAALGCYTGEL